MNKQQLKKEAEEILSRAREGKDGYQSAGYYFNNGSKHTARVLSDLIDQLEESEPVELPEWVVDILEDTDDEEYNKNFKRPYIKLYDIVYGKGNPTDLDTTQEKFLNYIHSEKLDIDEAIKKVMYAIATGNYVVKKDPIGTLRIEGIPNEELMTRYVVLNEEGQPVLTGSPGWAGTHPKVQVYFTKEEHKELCQVLKAELIWEEVKEVKAHDT